MQLMRRFGQPQQRVGMSLSTENMGHQLTVLIQPPSDLQTGRLFSRETNQSEKEDQ